MKAAASIRSATERSSLRVVASAVALSFLGAISWIPGAAKANAPAVPAVIAQQAASRPRILFDDFFYATRKQFEAHGWTVRTKQGWPGVPGAAWAAENVSFVDDPARRGNRLLRMSSSTDGTAAGTRQTQICHQRKYLEGTYATRIRFRNAPTSGADGDHVVETFYAKSPLKAPLDPDYSELDYEYLPNGGWGTSAPTLFVTTWETVSLDPWIADTTSTASTRSLDGWHTLVLQVGNGEVNYYVDGIVLASHGGKYYPEVPMSINYNLWFIQGSQLTAGNVRRYDEDVDWVFHQAGVVLSPQQVRAGVARLRRARIRFQDTVPVPSRSRHPANLPRGHSIAASVFASCTGPRTTAR